MITKVKLVNINVINQDKALAFYTETLGFKVVTDQPMSETSRWIEVQPPDGETRVVLFKESDECQDDKQMSNIIFTSDDVKMTYEELKERGVEFITPPTEEPWGTYAIFADVDGNRFLLSSTT